MSTVDPFSVLVQLPEQWRRDQETYPPHIGGQVAAAAVRLCADELANVLEGRDRTSSSIGAEIAFSRGPAEAVRSLSAMLAMDPADTIEDVKQRALVILSHIDSSCSFERHVDALAEAGLLNGSATTDTETGTDPEHPQEGR